MNLKKIIKKIIGTKPQTEGSAPNLASQQERLAIAPQVVPPTPLLDATMQTTACNHSATLVPSKTFDIDSYHVNSILNKLFRSLRDGEDRPATENLIAFMVDRGITRADAEECVNRCCNIFQVALKSCVGNREEACVLCAMELRASYGCCRDGQAQIVNLLGFRRGNEVVRQAMEVFLIDGWIEVVHDEESEDYFELIHPISNWESEGTGSVELLRMLNTILVLLRLLEHL